MSEIKFLSFIVILGGGVDENEEITAHSKLRHDVAVKLKNKYDYIICSSYKTYKPKAINQIKTEAMAGKEYLVKNGVNSNNILLEEISKDTFSNAYYSRLLIENLIINMNKNNLNNNSGDIISKIVYKLGKVTIVTSKFHMPKTKLLFYIVFPKNQFEINFISSKNGDINEDSLKNRLISEKELIKFYKKYLKNTYNIESGNMNNLKYFMENNNPALIGFKDIYHENLTKKINSKLNKIDPLY